MTTLPVLAQHANTVVVPRARDYLVDGVRFQRVTTALGIINKPALIPWAKRVALAKVEQVLLDPDVRSELVRAIEESPGNYEAFVSRVLDRASKAPDEARDERAGSGTEVHAIVQEALALAGMYQDDFVDNLDVVQRPAIQAAISFVSDFGIEVCDTERVVWSPDHTVAGTIDGVGFCDGKLVIWDWKTGANIYWETALQLAAYAHLLTDLTGVSVDEAYAVRLPRQGDEVGYEVKRLGAARLAEAWAAYRLTLGLHRANKVEYWEEADA